MRDGDEELELTSSKVEEEKLVLNFNRELTEEDLVKEHLKFQITKVYRHDNELKKYSSEYAKNKGLSEAKDLSMEEVNEILGRERKEDNNEEDEGGWGGAEVNWDNLKVEKDGKIATISIKNDLISYENLTDEGKINSKNALKEAKGYKIGVYVGDKGYKIQLNTTKKEADKNVPEVTGKFIEKK